MGLKSYDLPARCQCWAQSLDGAAFANSSNIKILARKRPSKKANPRKKAGKKAKKLSPKNKAAAKRSAKKAGPHYPNLVDNMRAAIEKRKTRKKLKAKKR
jgi:hypothetical protein